MGIQNHTPDPVAGAAVDAANNVALPDDGEKVKCDNIRLGDEQIADWVAFIKGGGSGAYVNAAAQPAGGYTFTGNPGIIKGTGIRMDGSPLDFTPSGSLTFSTARAFSRPLNTIMESLATGAYSTLAITAGTVGRQGLDTSWHGVSVTSVSVAIDPADDGLTPGTKTQVELTRKAWSTGAETSVGAFVDASPSEAYHVVTLDLSATPHVVDLINYQYFVRVTGESGGDASTITWHGSRIGFSMSSHPFA